MIRRLPRDIEQPTDVSTVDTHARVYEIHGDLSRLRGLGLLDVSLQNFHDRHAESFGDVSGDDVVSGEAASHHQAEPLVVGAVRTVALDSWHGSSCGFSNVRHFRSTLWA